MPSQLEPKLTTGTAGSGKTTSLFKEVCSLIEKGCSSNSILIFAKTQSQKKALNTRIQKKYPANKIQTTTIGEFCRDILKKNISNHKKIIIQDFLAFNIIQELTKSNFAPIQALLALTKSNSFSKELFQLFGQLKNNNIKHNDLLEILNSSQINETDKLRLRSVFNVFKSYCDILEQHNFIDTNDLVQKAIEKLHQHKSLLDSIKEKAEFIFIDEAEKLNPIELELIELVSAPGNLFIYIDEILNTNKLFSKDKNTIELGTSARNPKIFQRALYLLEKYSIIKDFQPSEKFEPNNDLKYLIFEDAQSEITYIADEILLKVKNKESEFSDFAILTRNDLSKQRFIDIFKAKKIPINSELHNENFENLKLLINRYIDLCGLFDSLGLIEFSADNLKQINLASKSKQEILFEEINELFEIILSEILEDNQAISSFLSISAIQNRISLINIATENLSMLRENDKKTVLNELGFLNKVFFHYKNNDYVNFLKLIAKKEPFSENCSQINEFINQIIKNAEKTHNLYHNVFMKKFNFEKLKETLDIPNQINESQNNNAVRIEPISKVSGVEFEHVYIPCLDENNFPKNKNSTYFISPESNKIISQNLKARHKNFKSIVNIDKDNLSEEIFLFYTAMTRSKHTLSLSTHLYQDKKQLQLSPFFRLLIEKEKLNESDLLIKKTENTPNPNHIEAFSEQCNKTAEKIISNKETLKLNTSSIGNFLACPLKYYYSNLLNLKQESNFEANYGTIVHSVLEVFNNKCLNDYNKAKLLELADILFDSKISTEKAEIAIKEGFCERDTEKIINADDLSLAQMKDHFKEAIEELDKTGFFETIPEKIETEITFNYKLPNVENINIDGRIDAIYKNGENYTVIDYKTGKTKKPLSYYLSDFGLKFEGNYGKFKGKFSEKNIKEYEYQIPLYYFACQNAQELEDYKDKVNLLGLKYIRPKSINGGCSDDFIEASEITSQQEKIINNLKTTVVDKIRNNTDFRPEKSWICNNCSFSFICDKDETTND